MKLKYSFENGFYNTFQNYIHKCGISVKAHVAVKCLFKSFDSN